MSETPGQRLNRYISSTGLCSGREADRWIEDGRVTVNGQRAVLGLKVTDADDVRIDGRPLKKKTSLVYIALNKPVGIICTTDRSVRHNITDHVGHPERIFPIGRLDRPSEGLILLTNDGDIVNKILRAGNQHEKEYIVRTDKAITEEFVRRMASGIPILGTVTKKCRVEQIGRNEFKIVLTQGLNRQIRRMCEYLGYEVIKLKRTRIMHIRLGDLGPGQWRDLTPREMDELRAAVETSVKTEEASRNEAWDEA
jgi:23S rRNA pseudouridine2604 synthase